MIKITKHIIFPNFEQFATHCVANLTWTNIRLIMRLDNQTATNCSQLKFLLKYKIVEEAKKQ